jgi:hypothetical protein
MKKVPLAAGLTLAAATAVLLTGCHANLVGAGTSAGAGSSNSSAAATAPATDTAATPAPTAPAATHVAAPATVASPPAASAPRVVTAKPTRSGRPPQPAAPTTATDAVAGLTAAIARTPHLGLGICGSAYSSVIAAAGDLRGIGGTQYLVDTTCQGATGSSPDEIAIYQRVGSALAPTAGAPLATSYPYLDGPHTVVLTYAYGTEYRLDRIGATSITVGPLTKS